MKNLTKKILKNSLILAFALSAIFLFQNQALAQNVGSVTVTIDSNGANFSGSGFTGITDISISISPEGSPNSQSSGTMPVANGSFSYNYNAYNASTGNYSYLVIKTSDASIINSGCFPNACANNNNNSTVTQSDTTGSGSVSPSQSSFDFHIKNPVKAFDNLPDLIKEIINIVMLILTPIVGIMLIYAGYLFVTAQGDPGKLKSAKETLLYAVIGGAIILGAQIIASAIQGTVNSLL